MSSLMRWPKGHCPSKTPSTACGDGSDSWTAIFMPTAGRERSGQIFRQRPFAACSSCRRHSQIKCGGTDELRRLSEKGAACFGPAASHAAATHNEPRGIGLCGVLSEKAIATTTCCFHRPTRHREV